MAQHVQLRVIATLVEGEPVHTYESRMGPGKPMESSLLDDEVAALESTHRMMSRRCRVWKPVKA